MAQNYNQNTYDANTTAVQTLQARIESNFAVLLSKFSGGSAPSGAGFPVGGSWWLDTSARKLYIRHDQNTSWIELFDFATEQVPLATGQVQSTTINSSARKGTIVQDEAIAPASCAIRATQIPVFSVLPSAVETSDELIRSASTGTWYTQTQTKVYFSDPMIGLYMIGRLKVFSAVHQVKCRFIIGGIVSSESDAITGTTSYTWTSVEAEADISSLSSGNWYDLEIQIQRVGGTTAQASIQGYNFRIVNSVTP